MPYGGSFSRLFYFVFLCYNLDRKIYTPIELKSFCKNKNLNSFLAIFAFVAIAGFLFFSNCPSVMAADAIGNCMYTNSDAVGGGWNKYDITHADCTKACNDFDAEETRKGSCDWIPKSATGLFPDPSKSTVINEGDPLECSWWTNPINCPLVGILQLEGSLLSMSGTLFTVINKVDNFKAVVDGKAVLSAWKIVRDFLNIAFILVLLYSAFCTILQIEKYSYKKLLLTLVIMALLVNFSFPIARFIIDVSNTLMYTIINSLQYGDKATDTVDTAFGLLSGKGGLATILNSSVNSPTSFLLAAVIFVFIFAITLLAIGIMLLIRMIALAILIIFSPLAFVATILPDAGGYSTKWWDNLFKYAFFGPIMMFMIYVATQMMAEMSLGFQAKFITAAQSQSTMPNLVGTMAYFSIPIVILWLGMGIAQSMSIAGAATVMGGAQKFAKWVPKAIAHSTGIPGGFKKAAEYYGKKGAPGFLGKIPGLRGSEKTEDTEAGIAGFLTKGAKGYKTAQESIQRKRIAAKQKEFEDERLSETEAKAKMQSSDGVEKKAAALYLSKKDKINNSDTFRLAMEALAGDEELQKELRGKAKKDNNVNFVLDYDLKHGVTDETGEKLTKPDEIYKFNLKGMSAQKFAEQKNLHERLSTDANYKSYVETEKDDKFIRAASRFMSMEDRKVFKSKTKYKI